MAQLNGTYRTDKRAALVYAEKEKEKEKENAKRNSLETAKNGKKIDEYIINSNADLPESRTN